MNTYTKNIQSLLLGLALSALAFVGLGASTSFAEDDNDDEQIVGTAELSESDALKIADKAYTGDGRLTDVELEMEQGVLVYAVEYTESDGNEVDVKLNADTGAIVVIESDKTEGPDDDGDDEGDEGEGKGKDKTDTVASMQRLIDLLNQLIVLLRAQQ